MAAPADTPRPETRPRCDREIRFDVAGARLESVTRFLTRWPASRSRSIRTN